jgi:hypothetical protein
MLSAAKHLNVSAMRCFTAFSMTLYFDVGYLPTYHCTIAAIWSGVLLYRAPRR